MVCYQKVFIIKLQKDSINISQFNNFPMKINKSEIRGV